ncbi:permease [Hephaestia mangrovi]|uniref:permease n=1 Tax=Hephaestia mangrovi TaxID=2873268 RepID=UPI001CA69EAB|nr:permease [Hephaestia mangrovi]MBY8828023.1 permease [Hephaestia mangrovi]
MTDIITTIGQALLMAFGMAWKTGWALILGFTISSVLRAIVPTDTIKRHLGGSDLRQVGIAALFGAASSSCSYAAAAIMRTLFRKGASLVTSLAFLFAATNLVLELGIVLYLLMGWQFMVAEWLGGIALIAIMSLIVRLTYPAKLGEEARSMGNGDDPTMPETGGDDHQRWWQKLARPDIRATIARNFTMEWSMLWKDLAIGFVVGGFVAAFVPRDLWQSLFLTDAPSWIQVPANALIGPIVAMLTFVCSVGNIPLAAVLWGGGASFGGVIAFIYGDLIVLPLLDVYRRYFGWKMAAYIGLVLFASMAGAAIVIDLAFTAIGIVPHHATDIRAMLTSFSIDYTFWLNLIFGLLGLALFIVSRRSARDKAHSGCAHCH